MRNEYLFVFGNILHMTPDAVDRLRWVDFVRLCDGIDDFIEKHNTASQ